MTHPALRECPRHRADLLRPFDASGDPNLLEHWDANQSREKRLARLIVGSGAVILRQC